MQEVVSTGFMSTTACTLYAPLQGSTALLLACREGHLDCVRGLLAHQANIESSDDQVTQQYAMPIHSTAQHAAVT